MTAIERAVNSPIWPVILADQGNNTAGGSPGDGTAILAGLQAAGWPDAALFIRDAEAATAAWEAGVGGELAVEVGGKHEPTNGAPVPIRGTVRLLTIGEVHHVTGGARAGLGRAEVARCARSGAALSRAAVAGGAVPGSAVGTGVGARGGAVAMTMVGPAWARRGAGVAVGPRTSTETGLLGGRSRASKRALASKLPAPA